MLPLPLRGHCAQLVFHAQQRAEHIGVEGRGVALRRLIDDRAGLAFRAGVVDGDIEAAEAGDGLVHQSADLGVVAHVGFDEERLRTQRMEFGFERLALRHAASGNDQAGMGACECQGGGTADAGEGAGDEDNGLVHDEKSCGHDDGSMDGSTDHFTAGRVSIGENLGIRRNF